MSRFGYAMDVGKELEQEKEHIRKIEEELGPQTPGTIASAEGSLAVPPERKDAAKMDSLNDIPRNAAMSMESAAPSSTVPHNPDPNIACNCQDCVHRRTTLNGESKWWMVGVVIFVLLMIAMFYFLR